MSFFVLRGIFALAIAVFLSSTALAAPPASGLRGKSIELTWTDTRVEKRLDTGRESHNRQTSTIRVYISEQGRFFTSFDRKARGKRNRSEKRGVSGEGKSLLNWRSEGNTIVADQKFAQGARRVVVSFESGFSSCSVKVIHGKQGGAPIRYFGLTSRNPIELVSIDVTYTTCSIRSGNVFE
jgi:hypothetical protein